MKIYLQLYLIYNFQRKSLDRYEFLLANKIKNAFLFITLVQANVLKSVI